MSLNVAAGEVDLRLFKAIVEQTSEAMIFADRDGLIRVWNGAAEKLFGFAAAEVLGRSLDVIIPDRFRQRHWEGFRRAVASGRPAQGGKVRTTRSLHKLGRKLYVDLGFDLVTDDSGWVIGSVATGREHIEARVSTEKSPDSA